MAPRVERKPKTSNDEGQNRHHLGPRISDLCSDDTEVRTSLVKIDVEQWEGGDHDEAGHTKVDQQNVTRGPESSIS